MATPVYQHMCVKFKLMYCTNTDSKDLAAESANTAGSNKHILLQTAQVVARNKVNKKFECIRVL